MCARRGGESRSSKKGQPSGDSNPDATQRCPVWYDEAWSTPGAAPGGGWPGNRPPRPRLSLQQAGFPLFHKKGL